MVGSADSEEARQVEERRSVSIGKMSAHHSLCEAPTSKILPTSVTRSLHEEYGATVLIQQGVGGRAVMALVSGHLEGVPNRITSGAIRVSSNLTLLNISFCRRVLCLAFRFVHGPSELYWNSYRCGAGGVMVGSKTMFDVPDMGHCS